MRTVLPLLVFVSSAVAQVSATCPKIFKDSPAPGGNLLPAARTRGFIQTWYHGQNLPVGMVVTQMGWRYDQGANYPGGFNHTMEIVLDSTTATFSTLSNNFASNLSAAPTTFLPLTTVSWPPPPSGGNDPAMWIPGAVPFVFAGPHLLVQVDVQTEATPRSLTALYTDSHSMLTSAPFETGQTSSNCAPSSVAANPVLNGNLVDVGFRLGGAPPNSSAVFMLGAENQAFAGVNLLPLDLGFVGMTGCTLGVDPVVFITVPTDGSGSALLQGSVPNLTGVAQHLFAQCVHSGSTPLGLVTTNVAGVEVGAQGLSNYLYNWTAFTPTAQYGPYTTNRGAVILMR